MKDYEHVLQFAKENSTFENWTTSLKESMIGTRRRGGLAGGLWIGQEIKSVGERSMNIDLVFRDNSLIEGSLNINLDEVVAIVWNKILMSKTFSIILSNNNLRHEADVQLRHLVPIERGINSSYVLVLFHKDYKSREPNRLTVSDAQKKNLVKELYPITSDLSNVFNLTKNLNSSRRSSVIDFAINKEIFKSILYSNIFQLVIYQYPKIEFLSSTPQQAIGAGIANQKSTSSIGVIGKNKNGHDGCTTCYHDFQGIKVGAKIHVNGQKATINSVDILSDSCFATFDNPNRIPTSTTVNGPLSGISPRSGQICKFSGITSGSGNATVTSWDPSIPYIGPQTGLINMQKVYSTPSVNRGDSGAALVDAQGNVIGFAAFRTGVGFPVPFAAWIWAENVYYSHSIT